MEAMPVGCYKQMRAIKKDGVIMRLQLPLFSCLFLFRSHSPFILFKDRSWKKSDWFSVLRLRMTAWASASSFFFCSSA